MLWLSEPQVALADFIRGTYLLEALAVLVVELVAVTIAVALGDGRLAAGGAGTGGGGRRVVFADRSSRYEKERAGPQGLPF